MTRICKPSQAQIIRLSAKFVIPLTTHGGIPSNDNNLKCVVESARYNFISSVARIKQVYYLWNLPTDENIVDL